MTTKPRTCGSVFPLSQFAAQSILASLECLPKEEQAAGMNDVAQSIVGLTVRDLFAALAMHADICANKEYRHRIAAEFAYDRADAMIQARGV